MNVGSIFKLVGIFLLVGGIFVVGFMTGGGFATGVALEQVEQCLPAGTVAELDACVAALP